MLEGIECKVCQPTFKCEYRSVAVPLISESHSTISFGGILGISFTCSAGQSVLRDVMNESILRTGISKGRRRHLLQ